MQNCGTCIYFGRENLKMRGNEVEYGSCRVDGPSLGSTWIGSGKFGDAWVGQWPFVPSDAWCGRHAYDKDRTATSVAIGQPSIE